MRYIPNIWINSCILNWFSIFFRSSLDYHFGNLRWSWNANDYFWLYASINHIIFLHVIFSHTNENSWLRCCCCCFFFFFSWSIYEIHHNAWPIIENKYILYVTYWNEPSHPISWKDSSFHRFKMCNGTHWWNAHTHVRTYFYCGKCRLRTVLMHIIFWCSRRWPYYIRTHECVKFCTCKMRNCSNWMYMPPK